MWRCLAAYALAAPPLDAYFPLFSQVTHSPTQLAASPATAALASATYSLLETLCHLELFHGARGVPR